MIPSLLLAIVTLAATQADTPKLSLVGGPDRVFGEQTLTRTFQVEGAGKYDLAWQTRIFRGIVEKGSLEVNAPAKVSVELHLPAVRARVELMQDVQLKREGKVAADRTFPLALFPRSILADLAASQADLPPIGLYDPDGRIGPILEKGGIKFALLRTDVQARTLASRLVIVAPDQAETLAEPMGGIRDLTQNGGTVIFLEQTASRKSFFTEDEPVKVAETEAAVAAPLVGKKHLLLRDILPGDLSNWAGSGRVASHALASPEYAQYRPSFAASGGDDRVPLLAEHWGANGRAIYCQFDVGRNLAEEPAAQLILRNLIEYARTTPLPAPTRVVRMAIPPAAVADGKLNTVRFILDPKKEDLAKAAGMLLLVLPQTGASPAPGFDLPRFLADGGQVVIQSAFGDDMLAAVNRLVQTAWRDDPRAPLPRFRAPPLVAKPQVQMDYENPLAWGILSGDVANSLNGDDPRCIEIEQDAPGFRALSQPGILVKFTRGKSRLVLCALPVDDPEHKARARVIAQVVANVSTSQAERAE